MRSKSARTSYLVTVALVFAGCAASARPPVDTTSNDRAASSSSASVLGTPPGALSAFRQAPASEALVAVGPSTPFVSAGHGRDRFTTAWRASDGVAFGSPDTRPAGFVVCALHTERGVAKSLFCMRKESSRPGDWTYAVGDGYAAPFRRTGKLADCSACHAVGPREGLFDAESTAAASP